MSTPSFRARALLALATTALAGQVALAQTVAPRDADPKCSLGTVRTVDGYCRAVRRVPVELQYAGADRWNAWRAIQLGGQNRGYTIVEPRETPTADTKAVGRMHVSVRPDRVTITAELRGANSLSARCSGPRVVGVSGRDTSHIYLGALLVQSSQALMRCFDELWTTADAGRPR